MKLNRKDYIDDELIVRDLGALLLKFSYEKFDDLDGWELEDVIDIISSTLARCAIHNLKSDGFDKESCIDFLKIFVDELYPKDGINND